MLSALDHLVAATLAGARSVACDLQARDEYLEEYESFLALIETRRRMRKVGDLTANDIVRATSARSHTGHRIPCSI